MRVLALIAMCAFMEYAAGHQYAPPTSQLYQHLRQHGYEPIVPPSTVLEPGSVIAYTQRNETPVTLRSACLGGASDPSGPDYLSTELLKGDFDSDAEGGVQEALAHVANHKIKLEESALGAEVARVTYRFTHPFVWKTDADTITRAFKAGPSQCIDQAEKSGRVIINEVIGATGFAVTFYRRDGRKIDKQLEIQNLVQIDSGLSYSVNDNGELQVQEKLYYGYKLLEGYIGPGLSPAEQRNTFYVLKPNNSPERASKLKDASEQDHGITLPGSKDLAEPVWNAWVEASSSKISYQPARPIANHEYSLVLNLAALGYSSPGGGVYSTKTSRDLQTWIQHQNDIDSADVEVIVSLDRRFFLPQAPSERVKPLTIQMNKVRTAARDGLQVSDDIFGQLRRERDDASFWFGAQTFKVRTTALAGLTDVTFFIWANGRPVDEINVPICIRKSLEQDCSPTTSPKPVTLRGVDLSGRANFPDASLQFIERGSSIAGVFHCNTCSERDSPYFTWEISKTGDWFAQQVARILTQMTQPADLAAKEKAARIFERSGNSLVDLIFDPAGYGAQEARQAFIEFLTKASTRSANPTPPTLFVRLIPSNPTLVLTPLNVMHVKLANGNNAFVGELVNVETPLEFQDYSTTNSCISDWTLFVPPETKLPIPDSLQDVLAASVAFDPWIRGFALSCQDCLIRSEADFQSWLEDASRNATSEGVLMLSHHMNNTLTFYASGSPSVGAETVQRQFVFPSLAIIDACGTAQPGASEFIRQFNEHGVSTVIATYTEVEPSMAGEFLTNLLDQVSAHPQDSLSDAKFVTVRDLKRKYGSAALAFMLAGNGAIRVCPKATKTVPDLGGVAK